MRHESGRPAGAPPGGAHPESDPEIGARAGAVARTAARARSAGPSAPLLEREQELAELAGLAAEAHAGSGRLVVIEARAGLGKTRLLQAAREAGAAAGLRVLAARATEFERDFPFALVRQLFEPQLAATSAAERDGLFEGAADAARGALGFARPDADTTAPGDAFAVLHGLYWLLAALADRDPLLLAIDDAHWADASSSDWLGFLLPRLEELQVLLVVACRPQEPGAPAALGRIATDATARRMVPTALSPDAAATLLGTELGDAPEPAFASACHEVSGGNPFLLVELARALAAQAISPHAAEADAVRELTPERVTRTVLVRLERLAPSARAVARAVAVLDDDCDARLVAALAGLDADAVRAGADALRAAAILDPGATLRFIHPLVRSAVSADLPAGERAAEHARAAQLLRDRGAGPQQLAAHLVASDPSGDAATVETLVQAGAQALASGAPKSAIAYLTRALREPPAPSRRAVVLHRLFVACIRASDHAAFAAIEPDVRDELARDPALRSRWAMELTGWMVMNGRVEEAIALLEQGIEVAARGPGVERAFRLEMQMTTIAQTPPDAARERLAPYRARIRPGSPSERLAAALDARWALCHGSAQEAAAAARRALGPDGRILADQPELMAPGEVVMTLGLADQFADLRRGAEQALEHARERGAMAELTGAWALGSMSSLAHGELVAAEADMRQAVGLARLSGLLPVLLVLTPGLAAILAIRGDLEGAAAQLDEIGMTSAPVPEGAWFLMILFARGLLRYGQGRPREAAEDFVELHERKQRAGIGGSPLLQAGACAALALTASGDGARARELAAHDLARARHWGAPSALSFALTAQGVAVGGERGTALMAEAVAVLDGSPSAYRRASALAELGAALRRDNQRARAREPLREALELARRCGAVGVAKRVRDELLATGERVRRHTPIGVESLTPSERRVAEMAASGMTNRQVAQTLFLTVKTIETHLAAAYDKLGIRSRTQLAAALQDPAQRAPAVG